MTYGDHKGDSDVLDRGQCIYTMSEMKAKKGME